MSEKSILIKDTTREERIRIVRESLNVCGGACDFCGACDNIGGGSVDEVAKEIRRRRHDGDDDCFQEEPQEKEDHGPCEYAP